MHPSCPPLTTFKKRLVLQALIVATPIAGACGISRAQEPIQAIRLREIKDINTLDPGWIMGICNLPGLECNKVEVPKLYERRAKTGREFYAVMVNRTISRLVMIASGQWQLLNRWSFESYPLVAAEDGSEARMIDIHPALYPVGSGLWAVAVLDNRMESYSGGGAQFVIADFVTLDPDITDIGEDQRRFAKIPFSCTKTVRACFTDKDYKTSPHCQDESSGYLTLTYEPSATSRYYDWTATWSETSWPGGVPKSARKTTQKTLALKPNSKSAARDAFAFCDGGPVDP